MLNALTAREVGLDGPDWLRRAEATRRVFSLAVNKNVDVQKIHCSGINTIDIDPVEDRYLLSASAGGMIVIHDLHNLNGQPKGTIPEVCHVGRGNRYRHKFSVETVQWYPLDTGMFISSGTDKMVKVWDTNSLVTAEEMQFDGIIYSHDMSPVATQHCLIAVASQSAKVRLLDLKSGSATHTLRGHRQPVLTVRWSTRDEHILATGGEDSRVTLWDIRSAKQGLVSFDQHNGDTSADSNSVNTAHNGRVNGMTFTPDGLHLVTFGTDERLRVWETLTGLNALVNFGKVSNDSRKAIKFSVCTDTAPEMVIIPVDSNLEVFDLHSGAGLATLRGHYEQVNCCRYQDSCHTLYSGANDRNLLVWVPQTDAVTAFEEYLRQPDDVRDQTGAATAMPNFMRRTAAFADHWSSDED